MKLAKHFIKLFKDKEPRKNIIKIVYEVILCFLIYKEIPIFYFHKMLYRRENDNFKDYLSAKEFRALNKSKVLHNPSLSSIYRNKLLFDRILSEANIETPKLIAYKIGSYIYIKGSDESVYSSDIESFKDGLRKINNIDKEIFIKTVDTQGGDNCFVLNSLNIETIADELMNIKVLLFQERLKQHEVIKNIYPYSINTLRIDTYIDDSGEVIFLSSLIRFGANKSVVDNPGTSGGFFVPVNVETGEIKKRGMQFLKLGGNFYYNHPETKEVFGEIKIPYFNDAKTLIKRALKVVPEKMVGWDIAITENGPVIIEGNDNPSLFMSDLAIGGYKKNVTMRKILKLINNKDRK